MSFLDPSRVQTGQHLVRIDRIWVHLGKRDLRARYARTRLGVWWSASTLFVVVVGISLSVALVGGQNALDVAPRVAVAMGMWTFVSSSLIESADAFISDRGLLLNLPISEKMMTARLLWRNYLVLLHNSAVMLVFLLLDLSSVWTLFRLALLIFVFGPLVAGLLFVPTYIVSRVSAIVPDLRIFVGSAVQLNFFLTPILWDPPTEGVMLWIFRLNPLGWIIQTGKEIVFAIAFPWELLGALLVMAIVMLASYYFVVRNLSSVKKYL